jgi:hypothetical protein
MKKILPLLIIGLVITMFGCGTASKKIAKKSFGKNTDVFYEIQDEGDHQEGLVDLIIKAQIKTHPQGWYFAESKDSLHGKTTYPFLFNIDHQAIIWEVPGKEENDHECKGKEIIPDCGEGVRYVLEKRIRLKKGVHKIFFALPGDEYRTKFELTCNESKLYILELKPIYSRYRSVSQNYLRGVQRFDVFLNNEQIIQK